MSALPRPAATPAAPEARPTTRLGVTAALHALVVILVGALLWVVFGLGPLNGDLMWALVWGQQLADGALPSYEVAGAATPHPLATLLGVVLSVLGHDGAYAAAVGLGYFAYAALLVGTFRLGWRAFSWPVGLVGAGVLATSISLLSAATVGYLDVTVAALAVWAAVLEAGRPRRGVPVLALLALAGLHRPEMWLLSGAYWVYLMPGLTLRARVGTALLAAAAPVLWALGDLLVTGDPFFSFGVTREAIVDFARTDMTENSATGRGPGPLVDYLRSILRLPGVLGGVAGLALAIVMRRRSPPLPVVLAVSTGLALALEALAGVGMFERFVFSTAAALSVLFGFATVGWLAERPARWWPAWAAGGLLILLAYCASAPSHLRTQLDSPDRLEAPSKAREGLRAIVREPKVRAALDRCRPVLTSPVLAPYVLQTLGQAPGYVVAARKRGVQSYIRPRTAAAAQFGVSSRSAPPVPGLGEVARNRYWAVFAGSCARRAGRQ